MRLAIGDLVSPKSDKGLVLRVLGCGPKLVWARDERDHSEYVVPLPLLNRSSSGDKLRLIL